LERIEADIDLTLYKEAMDEHTSTPNDISFNEMMRKLNRNEQNMKEDFKI